MLEDGTDLRFSDNGDRDLRLSYVFNPSSFLTLRFGANNEVTRRGFRVTLAGKLKWKTIFS